MNNLEILKANAVRREQEIFKTYVPTEFLTDLKTYIPPQGRFLTPEGGLVLFSFAGKHEFIDDRHKPVVEIEVEEDMEFYDE